MINVVYEDMTHYYYYIFLKYEFMECNFPFPHLLSLTLSESNTDEKVKRLKEFIEIKKKNQRECENQSIYSSFQ